MDEKATKIEVEGRSSSNRLPRNLKIAGIAGIPILAALIVTLLALSGVVGFPDSHPKATYLSKVQPILDEDNMLDNRAAGGEGVEAMKVRLDEVKVDLKELRSQVQSINPGTSELREVNETLIEYFNLRLELMETSLTAVTQIDSEYIDSYIEDIEIAREASDAKLDSFNYLLSKISDPN